MLDRVSEAFVVSGAPPRTQGLTVVNNLVVGVAKVVAHCWLILVWGVGLGRAAVPPQFVSAQWDAAWPWIVGASSAREALQEGRR